MNRITEADGPGGEDVCAHAATVHERTEDRPLGIAVDHGAWLTQAHSPAEHGADREVKPDEAVEVDASGDKVAPVVIEAEGRIERVADLRLDQGESATRKP